MGPLKGSLALLMVLALSGFNYDAYGDYSIAQIVNLAGEYQSGMTTMWEKVNVPAEVRSNLRPVTEKELQGLQLGFQMANIPFRDLYHQKLTLGYGRYEVEVFVDDALEADLRDKLARNDSGLIKAYMLWVNTYHYQAGSQPQILLSSYDDM